MTPHERRLIAALRRVVQPPSGAFRVITLKARSARPRVALVDEAIRVVRDVLERAADELSQPSLADVRTPGSALLAGWLGAGCAQLRIVLAAHAAPGGGMSAAVAPNRRLIHELGLRAGWVAERGPDALRIVDDAQQWEHSVLESVMGEEWMKANLPELRSKTPKGYKGPSNAHHFHVKAWAQWRGTSGTYLAWWAETDRSHASRALANQYTRLTDARLVFLSPKPSDTLLLGVAGSMRALISAAAAVFERDGSPAAAAEARKVAAVLAAALDHPSIHALIPAEEVEGV